MIQKKRIQKIVPHLKEIEVQDNTSISVGVPITSTNYNVVDSLFQSQNISISSLVKSQSAGPLIGLSCFPSKKLNSVCKINIEGKFIVDKSLPKKRRYVNTIEWNWTDWQGNTHSEFRDIYRKCYQKKYVPPLSVHFKVVQDGGNNFLLVCDIPLLYKGGEDDDIRHCINLVLSLFGECHVFNDDYSSFLPINIKKISWVLLPKGSYPWNKSGFNIQVSRGSSSKAKVIQSRISVLSSMLNPFISDVYMGKGGFSGYIVFECSTSTGGTIAVLESSSLDNATYVFQGGWSILSQKTKREIIQGNLYFDRFIHRANWESDLKSRLLPLL